MPTFQHSGAEIYFEEYGEGHPVLMIAPGGMRSAIPFWGSSSPWNPIEDWQDGFRVIAMDQRNAGNSRGPVSSADGWHTYTGDQLALMDHLGIDHFHVAGMCIGGPYALGLIEAAPDRVTSAVLFQPIGRDNNLEAFHEMFDGWAVGLKDSFPELTDADWQTFRGNMYDGDKFLFNVDEDFVAACQTPLMVLCGKDLYHPESTSRTIARLAPDVTFIEDWKQEEAVAPARKAVRAFLDQHTP